MIKILMLYLSFVLLVLITTAYLVYVLRLPSPRFIIIAIFLIILSPLIVGYFLVFYIIPVPEVVVPDVTWQSSTEAMSTLREFGLKPRIAGSNYDKYITEGRVVAQDPKPKRRVKLGRMVNMIISSGQRKVTVPSLIGRPYSQVSQLLLEVGFKVGATVEVTTDKYQTGIILGQIPSPEVEIDAGSYVDLFISKNPKFGLIKMPYLIGKRLDEAEEILNDIRLNLSKITYQETDIIEENVVMRQEPMWDEDVSVGSSAVLTISKKPKEVQETVKEDI